MSIDGPSDKNVCGPDHPQSVGYVKPQTLAFFSAQDPFILEGGGKLSAVEIEYETYGELSAAKDNAVLICHALTGDAHAAGWDKNPEGPLREYRKNKPGWWDEVIGPGKPIDTRRFFVICANVLGSCYGSTGPLSINPETGQPFALSFPVVTVHDWARLHIALLDRLKIDELYAVVGGSVGGQQALDLALGWPERIKRLVVLSAAYRITAQGLGFNSVGRNAILNDPNFNGGNYYGSTPPLRGLAAARMLAHITYLSEESMGHKFGRRLQGKDNPDFTLTGVEFEVESYLKHQGESFVRRYDANSYLYITRAMDYYDAAASWGEGDLKKAASLITAKTMVVAFSSDWLFPPELCRELISAMCQAGRPATYVNIPSRYGHDAFLVETKTVSRLLRSFLNN